MAEKVSSYSADGMPSLLDELGEVRVMVEIRMPGTKRNRRGQRIGVRRLFSENEKHYVKDVVEIAMDQIGTYVRRNWEHEIRPAIEGECDEETK